MNIYEKLQAVQSELKAPKGQTNTFGNYKYRSCEDILEAVKPILAKHKAAITVGDDVVLVGDRFYIKAVARFYDTEAEHDPIENTAFAREAAMKKGMDDSQITGTASSYARKYCLNGLLLIDDTKDADTDEHRKQVDYKKPTPKDIAKSAYPPREEMLAVVAEKYPVGDENTTKMLEYYEVNAIEDLKNESLITLYNRSVKK